MPNKERVEKLEKCIHKQQLKSRIIQASLCIVFLVLGIVFLYLREASKEVIIHDNTPFTWEQVVYNDNYIYGIVFNFIGAVFLVISLLVDCLFCRFETIESKGHYVTVYRGLIKDVVYINGEEKNKIVLFSSTFVIETVLPNDVKVCVTFSRSAFLLAHISFSDNTPSIDV